MEVQGLRHKDRLVGLGGGSGVEKQRQIRGLGGGSGAVKQGQIRGSRWWFRGCDTRTY